MISPAELYNATTLARSDELAMNFWHGTALEVDVPVVQQVVGANVTVSGGAETASRLTYEGKMPLVFGFQAWRLFY